MAAVIKNYQHLIDMESRDNLVPDSETCVEAADLLITIRQKKFMFILYVVQRILLMLQSVDRQLHGRGNRYFY